MLLVNFRPGVIRLLTVFHCETYVRLNHMLLKSSASKLLPTVSNLEAFIL